MWGKGNARGFSFKMKMIKRVENVSMRNKELLIKRKNDSIRENHTAVAELWIGSATNLISGTFSFRIYSPHWSLLNIAVKSVKTLIKIKVRQDK